MGIRSQGHSISGKVYRMCPHRTWKSLRHLWCIKANAKSPIVDQVIASSCPAHEHPLTQPPDLVKGELGESESHKYLLSELLPRIGTLIESLVVSGEDVLSHTFARVCRLFFCVHELCCWLVIHEIRETHSTTYTFHAGYDITKQLHPPFSCAPTVTYPSHHEANELAQRDCCYGPETWSQWWKLANVISRVTNWRQSLWKSWGWIWGQKRTISNQMDPWKVHLKLCDSLRKDWHRDWISNVLQIKSLYLYLF